MRLVAIVLLAIGLLAGAASAALAKGPLEATVEGPGLDGPIAVSGTSGMAGSTFGHLVELTGFWQLLFDGDAPGVGGLIEGPPTKQLGAEYTITWDLGDTAIRQVVYPFAEGGPLSYIDPAVALEWSGESAGGWFAAESALIDHMAGYGVPMDAKVTLTPKQPEGVRASPLVGAVKGADRDASKVTAQVAETATPPSKAKAFTPTATTAPDFSKASTSAKAAAKLAADDSNTAATRTASSSALPPLVLVGLVMAAASAVMTLLWAMGRRPRRAAGI